MVALMFSFFQFNYFEVARSHGQPRSLEKLVARALLYASSMRVSSPSFFSSPVLAPPPPPLLPLLLLPLLLLLLALALFLASSSACAEEREGWGAWMGGSCLFQAGQWLTCTEERKAPTASPRSCGGGRDKYRRQHNNGRRQGDHVRRAKRRMSEERVCIMGDERLCGMSEERLCGMVSLSITSEGCLLQGACSTAVVGGFHALASLEDALPPHPGISILIISPGPHRQVAPAPSARPW